MHCSDIVQNWGVLSPEPVSLEMIRSLHVPSSHFRVSPSRYAAGTAFHGIGMAGRIYVLSGRCSLTVGHWQAELSQATYADFPAGPFQFQAHDDQAVELVNVWELPEPFRGK